ncbi:hypothetical protein N7537_004426 [Penicillium hordei]|uniref:Uncharacterized protein n=1 Tax=Penicillium hordei TaxID=40994 RepID=A0AAD6ECI5_9EURO|nr:uncharacterized protein N7537_004426 [Penicillium hordei]KAJ5607807.1 hypothetical protein N7537_004426 [Penicillium hordei]
MILYFLESRFKVTPIAISILMVCSIRGNTLSGLPFSAAELWSRGVYTIKKGAAIHAVEKIIRVLTKSNGVQNVSAGQTATKFQSLSLQANFDVQTNGTQHKIRRRMHRTPCFTPSWPDISNASSDAVSSAPIPLKLPDWGAKPALRYQPKDKTPEIRLKARITGGRITCGVRP